MMVRSAVPVLLGLTEPLRDPQLQVGERHGRVRSGLLRGLSGKLGDLERVMLTWSGSGVAGPGYGAGGMRVDDDGFPTVPASGEPGEGSEDSWE